MHYGSETWCLVQNVIGILHRTGRAVVRSMCGVKLVDKMLTEDIIQMLDMNETTDQLARANSVRWYGYALRKDKNSFLRRALDFKVKVT